jgi:integrase/recombinase XerD
MTRYSLKFQHWPVADQRMWQGLISPGHILEGAGVCAHWSAATQAVFVRDYGYWLSYLLQSGTDLAAAPPPDRVTPDRVRGYCQSMADVAAETRAIRVQRLVMLVRNAKPAGTWQWLLQMRRSLEAASRSQGSARRKGERIVPSSRLYDAGVRLLERTSAGARLTSFARASAVRDGLMIALLAARPLRLKNFAGLCIGMHLRVSSDGYLIDVPADECKTGRAIETFVPEELCPWLAQYLEWHRPLLLAGRAFDHVWINRSGRPFGLSSMSWRICELTQRLIGARVNPHLFRDCAATTIATVDPDHARMIAPLLGHATLRTAELHYNHARGLEAGRKYQAAIRQLRQEARPPKRRDIKDGST